MSLTEPIPVQQATTKPPRRASAIAILALILAMAALGLSAWTALRPQPRTSADDGYGPSQRADAKTATCAAVELVRRGVALNTNLQSPGGSGDVTGSLAVAANARLSLFDGGQYLVHRLDPATPTEVADAVRKFGDTLMDIGAAATAGAQNTDADQAARLRDADSENAALTEVCR